MKNEKLFKINERVTVMFCEEYNTTGEIVKATFTLPNGKVVENAEPIRYFGSSFCIYKAVSDELIYFDDVMEILEKSEVLDTTLLEEEDRDNGFDTLVRFVGNNDFVAVVKTA